MAKLADAIAANTTARNGPTCRLGIIMGLLSKADQADLRDSLADVNIPSTAIGRGLTKIGHQVLPGPVQRHRRGDCACHG